MTDQEKIEKAAKKELLRTQWSTECPDCGGLHAAEATFVRGAKFGVRWSEQHPKPPAEDESLQEQCKNVVDDWRAFWMNQTQNSKEDYNNYFRRAMGVDANMGHHLAKKFAEFIAARANDPRVTKIGENVTTENVSNENVSNESDEKLRDELASLFQDFEGDSYSFEIGWNAARAALAKLGEL